MAQVDVQWPSEDEDFDATLDKAATKPRKSVTVIDKQQPDQLPTAPEAAPATVPDTEPIKTDSPITHIESASSAVTEAASTPVEPEQPDPVPKADTPEPDSLPTEATADESQAPVVAAAPSSDTQKKQKGSLARLILEVLLVAGLVGLGLWAWTLRSDNHNLKQQVVKLNADPQTIIKKQTDDLITKVGKLIDLPKNESPTIANVSDAEAAKKQSPFFNEAQNGDKVLMYVKAGQAILYRPSTDKIILQGPLTFNNSTASDTRSTPTPTTTTKTIR